MTLIEQIKAEIERQKTINKSLLKGQLKDGCLYAFNQVLNFLSTLESGRPEPYNPIYDEAYLNEKIKKATESWKGVDVDAMLAECRGYDEEKSEKPIIPDGLDEEVHRFFDECIEVHEVPLYGKVKENVITADCYEITARHFAEWQKEQDDKMLEANWGEGFRRGKVVQKEQMLKEAEEGKIAEMAQGKLYARCQVPKTMKAEFGDKVRIIILPKED